MMIWAAQVQCTSGSQTQRTESHWRQTLIMIASLVASFVKLQSQPRLMQNLGLSGNGPRKGRHLEWRLLAIVASDGIDEELRVDVAQPSGETTCAAHND